MDSQRFREPQLMAALVVILLLTAINPHDYPTWILEVAPVLIALPLLWLSARHMPLTPLLCGLILLHALVLMVGGHYTYAKVPLGFWAQDWFGFERNHYDRLGHFLQGFEPAILAREILLRRQVLRRGGWLLLFVVSVTLAFSAIYELIEWLVALISEEAAESFLGTQGDVWDTQWDMFMCLLGSLAALGLLSRLHDRQLAAKGVAATG
jgi:putative membrane protein